MILWVIALGVVITCIWVENKATEILDTQRYIQDQLHEISKKLKDMEYRALPPGELGLRYPRGKHD